MCKNHTSIYISILKILILITISLSPDLIHSQNKADVNIFDFERNVSNPIQYWYHRDGDDDVWSHKDIDINSWEAVADKKADSYQSGIQWFRALIQFKGKQNEYDVLAIRTNRAVSAFEIYWDGELVGKSGVVANSLAEEIPGQMKKVIRLKRELTTPGIHVVAFRVSNYHTNIRNPLSIIEIGYHYDLFYTYSSKGSPGVFTGGALLIAGLFCIALFFAGSRHRTYLLFALYCFITLFFKVYPIVELYGEINIEHLGWIYPVYQYGVHLSGLFLVAFILYTYEIPKKLLLVSISVLLLFITYWLESTGLPAYVNYNLLPLLAGIFLVYSIVNKVTGSVAAFSGLVIYIISKFVYLFPPFISNYSISYIIGDIIFLFCIVLSISRKIYEQNEMLQEIKLRSSRLEVDLLKKNIQPHFILNTLQSIMNWIKKKPDNALKLIEALAEEFKMINRISDKKQIPVHQEIELCETHLKIMSLRMDAAYELTTDGLCSNELVPPMIFHTMIENALTHSFKTREAGAIRLTCRKQDHHTVYQLSNNGSRLKEISHKSKEDIHEGMGIKYIKTRLQESFPDKWSLDYTLDESQWQVTIDIHNN